MPAKTVAPDLEPGNKSIPHPNFSYRRIQSAWFVFQGAAYPVMHCPRAIFQAFIEHLIEALPPIQKHTQRELFANAGDDVVGRWFKLDSLGNKKKARLVLYASEQEARAALKAQQ